MKGMEKTGARLMAGEKMPLCGFCTSYGELMMAGAVMDDVETGMGKVALMTSSDPKVVEKIHTHAERTIKEYEKMLAGHEHGHGHDHGHSH